MPGPINGGGPLGAMQQMIFNKLYQTNPVLPGSGISFRDFLTQSQGKTPEQAFQEQGLDYSQYQNVNPNQIMNMLGF